MTAYELGYTMGMNPGMKKEARGFIDWLFRAKRPMLGRGRAPYPLAPKPPPKMETTILRRRPEQPVPPLPPAAPAAPSQVANR